MAHLIRQQIVYFTKAGRRVSKSTRDATKQTGFASKWYGSGIPGQGAKRFPLATDKRVAQKLLDDMVQRAERGQAVLPDLDHAGLPLAPLVVEFEAHVSRKAGAKHTEAVVIDVRRVLNGCKLLSLSDLLAKDIAARAESFVWGLVSAETGIGPATAAYCGKHARSFTRWLWRKRRLLDYDPLAGMDLPSQEVVAKRRAFSTAELALLIESADSSAWEFRYLKGPDRAILYLLAVATGYRAGELALLTPANFDLDADVPVARLKGSQTKNKKAAEQPLPPAVVSRMRTYLAGKPSTSPVWPGT